MTIKTDIFFDLTCQTKAPEDGCFFVWLWGRYVSYVLRVMSTAARLVLTALLFLEICKMGMIIFQFL